MKSIKGGKYIIEVEIDDKTMYIADIRYEDKPTGLTSAVDTTYDIDKAYEFCNYATVEDVCKLIQYNTHTKCKVIGVN